MSQKVSNVTTAKPKVGGAVFVAPTGTALPTDATSELDKAFVSLGYISEDGMTNTNSPETDTKKAWGGDPVYTSQTSKDDEFSFTLIEALNVDVLKAVYGEDNVTGDLESGIHVKATTTQLPTMSYVIDTILRDNTMKRIVIAKADITEIGEISYTDDDLMGYEITLSALPEDGVTHDEYIATATSTAKASTASTK